MKKHKLLKKIVALLVVITITCNLFTAYAHTGEYYSLTYVYDKQENLVFLINSSALNDLFTMDVYESALSWNGISDNVSVNVVKHVSGMPTSGFTGGVQGDVYGEVLDNYTLGTTRFYGSNGQNIETDDVTAVFSVLIIMNTDTSVFRNAYNPTEAAKKSFTHEVGHALMLTHPLTGSYSGHTISGKPYSVMNQGLYGMYSYIAMSPMIHDKKNLEDKWG